jgi:hypothetical protein
VSGKIFISYRREDSAANALGISQYLEKEFGRNNVFIDIDMRAGAKFPIVLEQRLAECKVMLVLISSGWLNAQDEEGAHRLGKSDDWVRLEIATALKRAITVIPVRVNGAPLPPRAQLPADIQGLLDHQATSVTNAGFRHDMAGLVHDIRAIPSPRSWRRFGTIGMGVAIGLAALASLFIFGLPKILGRFRSPPVTVDESVIWPSAPGEWVLYGANTEIGYYFKSGSIRKSEDTAIYTARYPYKPAGSSATATYQDDQIVFDCKAHKSALAESTMYDKAGHIVSHYKRQELDPLTASSGQPVKPGSILAAAEQIMCDDKLRDSLADKLDDPKLKYLSRAPSGDGDMFYGPPEQIADGSYEILMVTKLFEDGALKQLFRNPPPLLNGISTYRSVVSTIKLNCTSEKFVGGPKIENFDARRNLVFINLIGANTSYDIQENSPVWFLRSIVCGAANVRGTYEGMNDAIYTKGGSGEQKISIEVEQDGGEVTITFQTANGAQGKGTGTLTGMTVNSIVLQSTAPGCPGSYQGSLKFVGDTVTWTYKGEDCGGQMEGHGSAKKKVA